MKLGELEFKAEDFKYHYNCQCAGNPALCIAKIATRLLRERLQPILSEMSRLQDLCRMQEQHGTDFANSVSEELKGLREYKEKWEAELAKAPLARGDKTVKGLWYFCEDHGVEYTSDTHTARLVCISSLRSEGEEK